MATNGSPTDSDPDQRAVLIFARFFNASVLLFNVATTS